MNSNNELVKMHLQRLFSAQQRGWAVAGLGLCTVLLAWLEYLQPQRCLSQGSEDGPKTSCLLP